MNAYYTLKNGQRITLFFWSDFAANEDFRKTVEVRAIKPDGYVDATERTYSIKKDGDGIYFHYKGNKVYINDFDYMTDDALIEYAEKVKDDRGDYMFQDMLLATLIRGGENLGFEMKSNLYEIITPFGFCIPSEETVTTLFVPIETDRYSKRDWHYKIDFQPIEGAKGIVTPETYYFSDFASLIKEGFIKVVDKAKYVQEKKEWAEQKKVDLTKKTPFRKKKELSLQEKVDLVTYLERKES